MRVYTRGQLTHSGQHVYMDGQSSRSNLFICCALEVGCEAFGPHLDGKRGSLTCRARVVEETVKVKEKSDKLMRLQNQRIYRASAQCGPITN
jgi:hypothetical protein